MKGVQANGEVDEGDLDDVVGHIYRVVIPLTVTRSSSKSGINTRNNMLSRVDRGGLQKER